MDIKKLVRPLHKEVGFRYSDAVLQLREFFNYDELAIVLGYKHRSSVSKILKGAIPSHRAGEALWILFIEVYGHKPPYAEVHLSEPKVHSSQPMMLT